MGCPRRFVGSTYSVTRGPKVNQNSLLDRDPKNWLVARGSQLGRWARSLVVDWRDPEIGHGAGCGLEH